MVNCICSAASFGSAALRSALPFAFSAPPVKKAFVALRRACRGKAPPSANADRSAAQKPHWGFHCYAALRKRGRSKREIKNNYSAEDAQSASGGHSQSFLYKKPAGHCCTAGFGLQFTLPWPRALPQPWLPALLRGQQRERRASPRASGDWGRPSAGTG